jgi:DNA polymerase-3 subunit delta
MAVRAAGMQLAKLRRAGALIADGTDPKIACKAAGVFWKQEREFLRQIRGWTLPELDRVQPDVLEADRACKSSGAPDTLLAERLFLSIAGRAKRLGL